MLSSFGSLIFHLLLILTLGLISYPAATGDEGEEVAIGEMPVENLTESKVEDLDTEQAEEETVDESTELENTFDIETPEPASGDAGFSAPQLDVGLMTGSGGLTSGVGVISGGGGGSVGGGSASFMGLSAKGSRFCIVADCSGSMSGGKLKHVKIEVEEMINSMKGRARFQVIFFQSRAIPYPKTKWLHPKRDKAEVLAWLNNIGAGGGTNPTPAFQAAFNLSPPPDQFFFMTDGAFGRNVATDIQQLNAGLGKKKAAVNTISFVSNAAEALMRQIAQDSGGKYRHVAGF
jgi:hypothetical protein